MEMGRKQHISSITWKVCCEIHN